MDDGSADFGGLSENSCDPTLKTVSGWTPRRRSGYTGPEGCLLSARRGVPRRCALMGSRPRRDHCPRGAILPREGPHDRARRAAAGVGVELVARALVKRLQAGGARTSVLEEADSVLAGSALGLGSWPTRVLAEVRRATKADGIVFLSLDQDCGSLDISVLDAVTGDAVLRAAARPQRRCLRVPRRGRGRGGRGAGEPGAGAAPGRGRRRVESLEILVPDVAAATDAPSSMSYEWTRDRGSLRPDSLSPGISLARRAFGAAGPCAFARRATGISRQTDRLEGAADGARPQGAATRRRFRGTRPAQSEGRRVPRGPSQHPAGGQGLPAHAEGDRGRGLDPAAGQVGKRLKGAAPGWSWTRRQTSSTTGRAPSSCGRRTSRSADGRLRRQEERPEMAVRERRAASSR